MTQGFTDAQREFYHNALEEVDTGSRELRVQAFIDLVLAKLDGMRASHPGTIPAIRRGLRLVRAQLDAMDMSNTRLRSRAALKEYPFEPMPDPLTNPLGFVRPGQVSVVYLGGYNHLTQSTIVAIVLRHLFEHRASLGNKIPPFLAVVEEAHNFIPSRGEGQTETPSVEVIRQVITEGRKFGTGLLLISQRPSRLDETALSQCNTFLVLRLVNPRDQSFVEKVMENLSKADSRLLPSFGPGQGIVSGQAVRFPLLMKVRYDHELERGSLGGEDFLGQAEQWTGSPEAEAAAVSDRFIAELDDAAPAT
jgi:DNA helicase HerA-like ATPase